VTIADLLMDSNVMTFEFLNQNFTIPAVDTHYQNFEIAIPNGTGTHHIIGFEHILDTDTLKFVHHLTLSGTYLDGSTRILWAWAPGIEPLVMPSNVGFLAGDDIQGVKILHMQTHFDNPNLLSGFVDNSGIRVYYTKIIRPFHAGVVEIGDEGVSNPTVISSGISKIENEYDCPAECTNTWPNDIYVFGSLLHMHKQGSQAWSTLWRNGTKVQDINRVEFYDFKFQQVTPVNVTIKPGDRISMHCVFAQNPLRDTVYGMDSDQEMCINILLYYPKPTFILQCAYYYDKTQNKNLTRCNSGILGSNPSQLDPAGGIIKIFGYPHDITHVCDASNLQTEILTGTTGSSTTSTGTTSTGTTVSSTTSTGSTSSSTSVSTGAGTNNSIILVFNFIFLIVFVTCY